MSYSPPVAVIPTAPMVSTFGRYSMSAFEHASVGYGNAGSAAWTTSKRVVYHPILLDETTTALQLWWLNGATASGNVDCGIYNSANGLPTTKIVSTGSTAQNAGLVNVVQAVDITDTTVIGPRLIFLALTMDNTTGTIFRASNGTTYQRVFGMAIETTGSFGLPTTATPVTVAGNVGPTVFGFSTVTTI